MQYPIYLEIRDDKLIHKVMEPEDTLNYKFIRSDEIESDLLDGYDNNKLDSLNKNFAMICHEKLMKLRLLMKTHQPPGNKLLKQEKYYRNVLAAYLDYFQGKEIQFPQWRLGQDNIPSFATNLVTEENIRLSPKQGKFVKLFHEHFTKNKIGEEWMWFSEAYNRLEERYKNPNWNSMTDIFEKREGREKLNKLFDSITEGRIRYYRIKTVI